MGREGVEITGMVRKVDGLGRVVLPIELRCTMGIDEKDPLEIFVNGEKIIFKEV
jgi:transcriptional pleiotropic regulator of transition state genes